MALSLSLCCKKKGENMNIEKIKRNADDAYDLGLVMFPKMLDGFNRVCRLLYWIMILLGIVIVVLLGLLVVWYKATI